MADEFDSVQNKEGLLIIIDCTPSMWEPQEDGSVPVTESLKAALQLYKNKALEAQQDEIGLMLFGVPNSHHGGQQQHIHVVHPLQPVDVSMINQLQEIVTALSKSKVEAYRTPLWQKQFGVGKPATYDQVKLALVFSEATVQISYRVTLDESDLTQIRRQQRKGSKRVLMFTNVDDPHSDSMQLLRAAIQRGGDLVAEKFVTLELLAMNRNGKPFDVEIVYKSILLTQTNKSNQDSEQVYNSVQIFKSASELSGSLSSRRIFKRSLASIPFAVTDKLMVGIKVYNLIMEAKIEVAGKVDADTFEEVVAHTEYVTEDGKPYKLVYGQQYGGQTIQWTQDERTIIQNPLKTSSGVVLLGFKPRQYLRNDYNFKQSAFLYPDNKQYDGSVTIISAMVRKMTEMNQVAIVQFQPRRGFQPVLAALLPQLEVKNEYGYQEKPAGLVAVSLPFADYIRDVPNVFNQPLVQLYNESNVEDSIKQAIQHSMMPQLPVFSNPNLQTHYNLIESLALQTEPRPVADQTQPHMFDDLDLQLLQDAFHVDPIEEETSKKKKKKREDSSDDHEAKKSKPDKNVVEMFNEGKISKCTVPELKAYLKEVGLSVSGKKNDLLERIEQHLKK